MAKMDIIAMDLITYHRRSSSPPVTNYDMLKAAMDREIAFTLWNFVEMQWIRVRLAHIRLSIKIFGE